MTKAYDEFTHTIDIGITYVFTGSDAKSGYYEDNKYFCSNIENRNDPRCDFYNITDVDEAIQVGFSQYVFDITGNQKLYHRLAQRIFYNNLQTHYFLPFLIL